MSIVSLKVLNELPLPNKQPFQESLRVTYDAAGLTKPTGCALRIYVWNLPVVVSFEAEPSSATAHGAASNMTVPRETHFKYRWTYDLVPDGPGATVVTEIYDCSRAPADARVDMDGGQIWIEGMTQTLERLAAVCAEQVVEHG